YSTVVNNPPLTMPNLTPITSKALLSKVFFSGNVPSSVYQFEYSALPTEAWLKNKSMDFFGFYNGLASNNNKPTLHFYANESDGRRLRVTPIANTAGVIVAGADRSVNAQAIGTGLLTKIIYPSGGFADITYEPNRYWDNSVGEELLGKGVRVKRIATQGGEIAFGKSIDAPNNYRSGIRDYEYKLGNNNTSGLLLAPIKLGYITSASQNNGIIQSVSNLGEEPEIFYSRVAEVMPGQGRRVYEFGIQGTFPETASGDWKATKSRLARMANGANCLPSGNVKNGFYTFPFPPSTNYGHRRGFLNKLSEYSETGTLVREKTQTASVLNQNPVVVKGIRFEKIDNIYYYGIYEMLTGQLQVINTEVVAEASRENPSLWMSTTTQYSYNSNKMLSTVTTNLPDGTVTVKKTKYANDFIFSNPVASDTMAVALKKLNEIGRTGEVVETITQVTLPGGVPVVSSSLILYRDFGNGRVLPHYLLSLPPGAALTEAVATGGNFVKDTDYKVMSSLKEYSQEGQLLSAIDNKRNLSATHYINGPGIPAVTLSHARAQAAVYEGFE
ncbi:MAG: hypothetical protein ACKOE6_14865, partial [Flammeovirgaceae bacterium]